MKFTSPAFILFFIVVAILFFRLKTVKGRNFLLLTASAVFYSFYKVEYLFIIALIIVIDYSMGFLIARTKAKKKKKKLLIVGIILNLLLLASFKYVNFVLVSLVSTFGVLGLHVSITPFNILLPLGISFHTFQGLSYLVEVYRGRQKKEKDLLAFSLYILFFPQLAAGPIERPNALLPQFKKLHSFDESRAASGFRLILWGLFKKILIADRLAVFIDPIFKNPGNFNPLTLLLAIYLFAYQIYADFSGYTDIARGTARVLGIRLVSNFNFPFAAHSPADFWNRWHMSLYSWFRDYVYIPLGGSRVSGPKRVRNVLVVFALSGLWHGASWHFVLWGLINGLLVLLSSVITNHTKKVKFWGKSLLAAIFTFVIVGMTWVFFRPDSLLSSISIISRIATFQFDLARAMVELFGEVTVVGQLVITVVLILLLESVQLLQRRSFLIEKFSGIPLFVRWGIYYALFILIISLSADIPKGNFIYFIF